MKGAKLEREKAILVLGMHRSGTSALTRVLNLLGVDLGGNFLKPAGDNRLGFWEHSDVVMLHEKLLSALGRSWDDTREMPENWESSPAASDARKEIAAIISRDFSGSRLWAIKDPRLCRLAPLWVESLAALDIDVCALFVVRHPQEVADSLQVRDGLDTADARLSWLEYFVEAEYAMRSLPRALVLYDDVLSDWQQTLTTAGQQLQLEWPKSFTYAAPAVAAFLKKGERHHKASGDVSSTNPDVAAELYARCVACARGGGDWREITALVDAYRLVAPIFLKNSSRISTRITEAASRLQKAEALATDQQEEIRAAKEEIRDGERRIHGLLETVHGKDINIGNMTEIICGKDVTIQRRDELISSKDTEIRRRDELVTAKDAEIRRRDELIRGKDEQVVLLGNALQERERKLRASKRSADILTGQLEALRGQLSSLIETESAGRARLAEMGARVADIEASRSWRITRPLRAIKERWATRKPVPDGSTWAPEGPVRVAQGPAEQPVSEQGVVPPRQEATSVVAAPTFNLRGKHCTAVILTTPHCNHVALEIKSALHRASIAAEIIFEMPRGGYRDTPHFVICPQFFKSLPGLYVSFQMEQSVSSRWFTDAYVRILENSFAILDYSIVNIAKLQDLGLHAEQMYHVPVGYLDDYKKPDASGDYDCDVLFYGDIQNERRRCFIEELKRVCKVKVHNDLFGDALHAEMARARLVVNIHYYEGSLLESTRLWECVSLGHLVVSERAADMDQHPELQQLVDFVDVDDLPAMVDRVTHWLNNDGLRRQRLEQNERLLRELPNQFDYHFYRFLLATDNISFEDFWSLAGSSLKLPGDKLCLNLPEYIARSQSFDRDNRFGFARFTGLRHSRGWIGCAMSYKLMMRLARQEGRKMLAICEDDVEFPPDFEIRWPKIQAHLAQTCSDWDVFSGLMADLHDGARIVRTYEEDGLQYIETDKLISMVFNVYGAGVFDIADAWDGSDRDENTNTIDRYLERQSTLRVLTTAPFLVGHKEELHSTLWGFQNTQYSELIAESSALLSEKLAAHLHDGVGASSV